MREESERKAQGATRFLVVLAFSRDAEVSSSERKREKKTTSTSSLLLLLLSARPVSTFAKNHAQGDDGDDTTRSA